MRFKSFVRLHIKALAIHGLLHTHEEHVTQEHLGLVRWQEWKKHLPAQENSAHRMASLTAILLLAPGPGQPLLSTCQC